VTAFCAVTGVAGITATSTNAILSIFWTGTALAAGSAVSTTTTRAAIATVKAPDTNSETCTSRNAIPARTGVATVPTNSCRTSNTVDSDEAIRCSCGAA